MSNKVSSVAVYAQPPNFMLKVTRSCIIKYMWQSCVEIEGYSIAYFDHIAAFEAPYRWTSVKDGAHMHFVEAHMSPAL